jgi:aspartate/methionine/tyrosine aminotransferase
MPIPPFALERYFARWEFSVPHHLCASDVEPYRLDELLSLADGETRAEWEHLSLGYSPSSGDPRLRAAAAALYPGLEADDVLIFSGAEEAIFAFAHTALAPGDHAVVVWPAYQSLYEAARAAGVEVTLVELEATAGWRLDPERLREALRPTTRAVVINYPHSPTGALLTREDLGEIVALCRETGARLFSDEVYRGLEFEASRRLPPAAQLDERAVSLGVLSKSFALPGLRLGWVACRDRELLARLETFKDYTTICAAAPSELLGRVALAAHETVWQRSRAILAANLPHLDAFFERFAGLVSWTRPEGGSVAFPRLDAEVPVERFCDELRRAEGVLLLPGTVFGHPGNHFRVGLGRRDLPEVLGRVERFMVRSLRSRRL